MKDNFFGKFFHPAYEYWDTFPTFHKNINYLKGKPSKIKAGRTKKNFFAFLHDSEHVLILIFESGKKCQKLSPPQVEKIPLF